MVYSTLDTSHVIITAAFHINESRRHYLPRYFSLFVKNFSSYIETYTPAYPALSTHNLHFTSPQPPTTTHNHQDVSTLPNPLSRTHQAPTPHLPNPRRPRAPLLRRSKDTHCVTDVGLAFPKNGWDFGTVSIPCSRKRREGMGVKR